MVLGQKLVGFNETIASNGTFYKKGSVQKSEELILVLKVEDRTDGTYNLELEHSPDGDNWASLGSTAALSANGMVFLRISLSSFHIFRFKLTSSAVTSGAKVSTYLIHS